MKKILILLTVVGLASASSLISPLANADAQGKGNGKFMHFFDANNDGSVTQEEFNDSAKARFAKMDSDHDGKVSKDEFRAYIKERRMEHRQKKFARMDSNNDGKVSKDEFVAYQTKKAERKFARMDKNNDGQISPEENATCKRGKYGKDKHRGGRLFHFIDSNGDGFVSQAESYEAWHNWFKRIDSNADGVVTADEVQAYRQQRHQHKEK